MVNLLYKKLKERYIESRPPDRVRFYISCFHFMFILVSAALFLLNENWYCAFTIIALDLYVIHRTFQFFDMELEYFLTDICYYSCFLMNYNYFFGSSSLWFYYGYGMSVSMSFGNLLLRNPLNLNSFKEFFSFYLHFIPSTVYYISEGHFNYPSVNLIPFCCAMVIFKGTYYSLYYWFTFSYSKPSWENSTKMNLYKLFLKQGYMKFLNGILNDEYTKQTFLTFAAGTWVFGTMIGYIAITHKWISALLLSLNIISGVRIDRQKKKRLAQKHKQFEIDKKE